MTRRGWGRCAAAVVLAGLLGCRSTDTLALVAQNPGPGKQPYIAGNLEANAQRAQSVLQQLGISAVATPDGEAVRIRGTTKKGDRFVLVLTRAEGPSVEWTNVRLEWEGKPDNALAIELLAGLQVVGTR